MPTMYPMTLPWHVLSAVWLCNSLFPCKEVKGTFLAPHCPLCRFLPPLPPLPMPGCVQCTGVVIDQSPRV